MSTPPDNSPLDDGNGGAGGGDGSSAGKGGSRRSSERMAERAADLFRRGRFVEAEAELRKALVLDPSRGELHFNLGLTLEAAGKLDEALVSFRDAALRLPRRPETRFAEGSLLCRLGRYAEAIGPLEAATSLDRAADAPWARLIEAKAGLGQHDDAETIYYVAQQQVERMPLCLLAMGDMQLQLDRFQRGEWCFREALRIAPELPRVRGKLGRALAQGGSVEAGLQMYLEELRLHPGDVQMLIECGDLLASHHRVGEAIEKYRRAAELAPTHALPHTRLGLLLLAVGRPANAVSELETAYALEPSTALVRTTLAAILVAQAEALDEQHAQSRDGTPEPSRGDRALALPVGPMTGSANSLGSTAAETPAARAMRAARSRGRAVQLLREELAQRKGLLAEADTEDLLRFAELFLSAGAAEDAIKLLERAIRVRGLREPALEIDARSNSAGRATTAPRTEQTAAETPTPSTLLARRLMTLSFAHGKRRQGRGLARHLARVEPELRGVCAYNLALDALECGRLRLAFGRLAKSMREHPHDPALRSLRARIWWEAGRRGLRWFGL